jgi:hypothetical protein
LETQKRKRKPNPTASRTKDIIIRTKINEISNRKIEKINEPKSSLKRSIKLMCLQKEKNRPDTNDQISRMKKRYHYRPCRYP